MVAPVFHELAGQLDRVPFNAVDAGCIGIINRCEHVLQTVAEFVEQRLHLAEGHQRRLSTGRRRRVANQMGHGKLQNAMKSTATETIIHPSAAPLVLGSTVRIEVERRDVPAALVRDLEKANVLVPHGRLAVGWRHADTEQTLRETE